MDKMMSNDCLMSENHRVIGQTCGAGGVICDTIAEQKKKKKKKMIKTSV